MNFKKALFFGLLLLSVFLPIVTFVRAQNIPNYVGIKEGATYTWKTEFDVDNLASYYYDLFNESSEQAELESAELAAQYFDSWGLNSKTKGWKIYIVDLYPEREEKLGHKEYNRVKYVYNWYKTRNITISNDWRKKDKYETSTIFEPNENLFKDKISLINCMSDFFIPKDLNFDTIYRDVKEHIEKEHRLDINKATVYKEQIQYFTSRKTVGLSVYYELNENTRLGSWGSTCKYNYDGILYYYEWAYDGDIIIKLELDTIGGVFLYENFWWISIIIIVAIISVIIYRIVVIFRRKKKAKIEPQMPQSQSQIK